jgi:hypothetical protein
MLFTFTPVESRDKKFRNSTYTPLISEAAVKKSFNLCSQLCLVTVSPSLPPKRQTTGNGHLIQSSHLNQWKMETKEDLPWITQLLMANPTDLTITPEREDYDGRAGGLRWQTH